MKLPFTALIRAAELLASPGELLALAPSVFTNASAEVVRDEAENFQEAVSELVGLAVQQSESTQPATTAERVELIARTVRVFAALFLLVKDLPLGSVDREQLRRLLVDVPLLRAMRQRAPVTTATLDMLGLVEVTGDASTPVTAESRINWDSIGDVLADPIGVARAGWCRSDGALDVHRFSAKLLGLLHALGFDVAYRRSSLEKEVVFSQLASGKGYSLAATARVLETVLFRDPTTGLILRADLIPFHERTTDAIAIGLRVATSGAAAVPLANNVELEVKTLGPPIAELAVLCLPGPSLEAAGSLATGGDFGVELAIRKSSGAAPISLYADDQFSVDVRQLGARCSIARLGGQLEFLIETTIGGLSFGAATGHSDGFVKKIASGGMGATFDLTVGWSTRQGLYFRGSGQLELMIPIHQSIGPLNIESLYLAIAFASNIDVTVAVSFGAKLGPVVVTVDRIGLALPIQLGGDPPVQLSMPSFKAPRGAGLVIDAGAVKGGGFIRHDEERSSYDGILDLKIGDIGLVAVAIITTKKDNFALFINIGVTFSPPITLPYNFNLQGCGGLCAVNRTMDTEALRSGLRNKTLDSILFPENPILNANKIISDSEHVFPIEEGRYVFGPMAKLGWGAKGLITANIAIVIEFPAPIVIALLGQLKARVPQSEDAKVKINLDVLGVLEIEKKSLSFDASLYDSKILAYDLSGDSAMRLRWGNSPVFALSVGGFHPSFNPPANFPSLKRLTLALSSGSSFELSCTVYHALTSNTLQFGARLKLHAEACGAELNGHLSFDTLFQFSPFEFEVGISGGVGARYKGHNIASVYLNCDLSGPNPWHAKGKAKVSVLFWDVTARFNKTWGDDNRISVANIDPLPYFEDEINLVGNWAAALSPRRSIVESLKSLNAPVPSAEEADASDAPGMDDPNKPDLLVHPAGALEFRQRLLPLAVQLEKFKNADVETNTKFDVRIELGPAAATSTTETVDAPSADPCVSTMGDAIEVEVKEHFARGQFKALSKAERLSKPSFERFRAGTQVGPETVRLDGCVQECELEYESILILSDAAGERANAKAAAWAFMKRALKAAALRRVSLRHRRLGRFGTDKDPRVALMDEAYSVVYKSTLRRAETLYPQDAPALNQTQAEDLIRAAVAEHLAATGSIIAVPEYEEVA